MPLSIATSLREFPPDMPDTAYFSRLCYEAVSDPLLRDGGINTYAEKRLHRVLKCYYEPDETRHEQKVGRYFADVLRENEIVEIQTASLHPLKTKIAYYLRETPYQITVVHPVFIKRWIRWLDPDDGSVSDPRRSPKKENAITAAGDLVYLCDHLTNPRLHFRFPLLEVEDYRLLNGRSADRKHHSSRYERFPIALLDELTVDGIEDFVKLFPADLPEIFTGAEFMRLTRIDSRRAYAALKVFCTVGMLSTEPGEGRARLYRRCI